MTGPRATEIEVDTSRVVARLFLPGEGIRSGHSRAAEIVRRVLAMPAPEVAIARAELERDFENRHGDLAGLFADNARSVGSRVGRLEHLEDDRAFVLGATFTAEYAVEGAALCNPSAVAHPDQSGLGEGELRVAVALRAIGEGHVSSIEFAEAVVSTAHGWRFGERAVPLTEAAIGQGRWTRGHLREALGHEGHLDEAASALIAALPEEFGGQELDLAFAAIPTALRRRRDSSESLDLVREIVASAYSAEFPEGSALSQRVLQPVAVEEDHGMEDARLVCFTAEDGSSGYLATYTAYDGRDIAPRLLRSDDLRSFTVHRLTGTGVRNKGLALFPRMVGGLRFALTRADGESIGLAHSHDGLSWADGEVIHRPTLPWELVQTGNCGPPLETEAGWLVLTHGVGPMRTYAMGALLLALDDPAHVLARSATPFLHPGRGERDGYVPNVVYSCGGIIHDGTLWVPYGIGDSRVSVFSIEVDELIRSMVAV